MRGEARASNCDSDVPPKSYSAISANHRVFGEVETVSGSSGCRFVDDAAHFFWGGTPLPRRDLDTQVKIEKKAMKPEHKRLTRQPESKDGENENALRTMGHGASEYVLYDQNYF
jgi:hypothetical protein